MFRWVFLLVLISGGFFVFDFFSHLEANERSEIKEATKELLDSGEYGAYLSLLGGKMREDFKQRFWPKISKAFDCLSDDKAT